MLARRECDCSRPPSAAARGEQVFGILMFGFGRTDVR